MKRYMIGMLGAVMLFCCWSQNGQAQTCWTCGHGIEPNECKTVNGGEFGADACEIVGSFCYLDNDGGCYSDLALGGCQPKLGLPVQIKMDVATIERLAVLSPYHAFALAGVIGSHHVLQEGVRSKVRFVPVKVGVSEYKYWLTPSAEDSKKYFADSIKESKKLSLNGVLPVEVSMRLVGNELTLTIESGPKSIQGDSIKLLLKDENIIKHTPIMPTVALPSNGKD